MLILESPAHDAAVRLGLSYYKFGRYGKDGKVTHESKFGRLVKVNHYDPEMAGDDKLQHLEHLEDEVFNNGVMGVRHAIDTLLAVQHNDNRALMSTKIDGCVHEDTVVMTNKGEMKIKNLPRDTALVMGHDFEDGTDKMVGLINITDSKSSKQWVEIVFENGQSIKVTEDHEIYTTEKGWIPAGQLTNENCPTLLDKNDRYTLSLLQLRKDCCTPLFKM